MKIAAYETAGVKVIQLAGRFDAHQVGDVRTWLTDAMSKETASNAGKIVVNLADVNFIDSSGLGCLVQGMKRCRERGGNLYLCNLTQPVRVIFELTRLENAFSIFPGEDQAVQAFMN